MSDVPAKSKEEGSIDAEAIGAVIRGIAEPLAEAEKVKALQKTKQVGEHTKQVAEQTRQLSVHAGVARQLLWIVGGLGLAVVILAFVAVFLGDSDLAEKIIVGVFGMIGGFGLGRASKRT